MDSRLRELYKSWNTLYHLPGALCKNFKKEKKRQYNKTIVFQVIRNLWNNCTAGNVFLIPPRFVTKCVLLWLFNWFDLLTTLIISWIKKMISHCMFNNKNCIDVKWIFDVTMRWVPNSSLNKVYFDQNVYDNYYDNQQWKNFIWIKCFCVVPSTINQ